MPVFASTASRRFVTANLVQKRRVAGVMAKNDNSFDQTSLDHDEKDHMMAKRPHLKRSEDKGTFSPETHEPGSVSHPRIVPKHIIC